MAHGSFPHSVKLLRAIAAPPLLLMLGLLAAGGAAHAEAPVSGPTAPGGDDRYRFAPGASEERRVDMTATPTGARWTWAAPTRPTWDTALLGVRITATDGKGEAWVELASGDARVRQHLDAGAHGLRWVNVSGLRRQLRPGATVDLTTHGATVTAGPATLHLFSTALTGKRPLLVVAPHPDDAEIAAFGLYAQSAANAATIVTVTSGNAGDANYQDDVKDPAAQYALKGTLRAYDSVTVPWQGGVPPQRCFNLGYFDARLQEMHDKPTQVVPELYGPNTDVGRYRRVNLSLFPGNRARPSTWAHLVADLQTLLRKVRPQVIVLPHPILDGHSDHDYSTVAVAEALRGWKQPVTFLLYTNHSGDNRYPYGPAATDVSLPPWNERDLAVQRVYAHPLDAELRLRKLYALEAMHDLRLSPTEQSCPPGPRRPDYPRIPDVDYFRRGPRPQEIFFVYDRAGFDAVVRDFLAHPPPP